MKRKVVSLLLLVIMLLSALAACGKTTPAETDPPKVDPTPTATTKATDPPKEQTTVDDGMSDIENMTAPGQLPIVKEPVKITFAFVPNATVTDYKDNAWTKWLEEQTGIEIDFFPLPTGRGEARTKLEMMLNSREPLPDIINAPLTDTTFNQMLSDGTLFALDEWMDKYGYFVKESLEKWLTKEERDFLDARCRSFSGDLIKFPMVYYDPSSIYSPTNTISLRKDWLNTLNLKVPQTTEELYTVLKAFKEQDPNGNGKADEIPMLISPADSGVNGINAGVVPLLNSFQGMHTNYLNVDANGKVYQPATTEAYREGLRYLNRLVKEELVSPLSFTASPDQMKAIVNVEEGQLPYLGGFIAHPTTFIAQVEKRWEHTYAYPIKGPEGKCFPVYNVPISVQRTIITKYCKNPEIAFRLLDYFWEEETMLRSRWGEKGDETKEEGWFYISKPGDYKCSYAHIGCEVVYRWTYNPYSEPSNAIWKNTLITALPPKLFGSTPSIDDPDEDPRKTAWAEMANRAYQAKFGGEIGNEVLYYNPLNEEETRNTAEIATSLIGYIKESQTRFIVGDLSLDTDWDTYLRTLEDIGLEVWLENQQTAYDRLYK